MDELTTSIVVNDLSNDDKSKGNRRMECMLGAPCDLVELWPEPKNPFDENAIATWSDRGVPLIGKRMARAKSLLPFRRCTVAGPFWIRFGGEPAAYPAQPGSCYSEARTISPKVGTATGVGPQAFYPEKTGPEWGA